MERSFTIIGNNLVLSTVDKSEGGGLHTSATNLMLDIFYKQSRMYITFIKDYWAVKYQDIICLQFN